MKQSCYTPIYHAKYGASHCHLEMQLVTKKGKAIPVTGREGPYGCETSRLPHFL
jgi:hypothetical protein